MREAEGVDDLQLKRLRYRAWRRGFREADLLLGGYADCHAACMTPAERVSFEALLDEPDVDIWAWVWGTSPLPKHIDLHLIARLQVFEISPSPLSCPGA